MAPPSPVDATERFRGILGYFTLAQTDRIEIIFEDIGEPVNDPRPSTHCGRTFLLR